MNTDSYLHIKRCLFSIDKIYLVDLCLHACTLSHIHTHKCTSPLSCTNTRPSPSSWPLVATVARGDSKRNRCCLAARLFDPADIWTHCFKKVGQGGGNHLKLYVRHFKVFCTSVCNVSPLFLWSSCRYKDLIIPTLGDKRKLSPEERCRSVLQQCKFQGWQVCVSSVFAFYFDSFIVLRSIPKICLMT